MHSSRAHFWLFWAAVLAIALTPSWRSKAALYDPDIPPALRTVNCANQSAFTAALANAIPGDHIILANGTYTFGTLTKTGTVANPIVIEALNNAGAAINCTSQQMVNDSSYVILNGLEFAAPSGTTSPFRMYDIKNCRVTRCSFDGSGFSGIAVLEASTQTHGSNNNRYDHNLFYGHTGVGIGGYFEYHDTGTIAISQYDRIDHNYFKDNGPFVGNGQSALRMGVGTLSLVPSYMVCEQNLFENCDGDAEVISVKSSCTTVRYNTYINCYGTGVSLRQGTNNAVYGNVVLSGSETGNAGIKITGFYHSVHDNYIEGVTGDKGIGALVLQGGDIDSVDSTGGHGVIDSLICTNNVLYNNAFGLEVGCKYGPYMPRNCTIANNQVQQSSGPCYNITGEGTGNIWFGNTARLTGTATAGSTNGVSVTTTNIDYAAYRALALTTNDVGPSAVESNVLPSVSLTAPTNGASFTAPASISLTANASDVDGTITTVSFYNGSTLIGSDTNSPYACTWTNVAAGSYNLTARATDNVGAISTSAVAVVTVSSPLAASFTAIPTNCVAPLNVTFTDASTGSPTGWAWDFGDTGTSTLQNPSHNYTTAGVYTVQLIASNASGSSTNTQTAHINVITTQQSWSNYYGVPADSADADGDGLNNTDEFLTGFNPTNRTAYPHIISIMTSNNYTDIAITYLGASGNTNYSGGPFTRTNVLECAVVPASGSFTNDFVGIKTNWYSAGNGLGTNVTVVDEFGATNQPSRYYRVRVLVP